jgi:hypothetical protein
VGSVGSWFANTALFMFQAVLATRRDSAGLYFIESAAYCSYGLEEITQPAKLLSSGPPTALVHGGETLATLAPPIISRNSLLWLHDEGLQENRSQGK